MAWKLVSALTADGYKGNKAEGSAVIVLYSIRCEGTVITGINLNSTRIVSTNVIAQGNVTDTPIMKQFVNNLRPKS